MHVLRMNAAQLRCFKGVVCISSLSQKTDELKVNKTIMIILSYNRMSQYIFFYYCLFYVFYFFLFISMLTSIAAAVLVQRPTGVDEERQIKEGFEGKRKYSWDGVGMNWGVEEGGVGLTGKTVRWKVGRRRISGRRDKR